MQAVVATGGKQYRVSEGDVLDIERVDDSDAGGVTLRPVMLVADDGTVTATPDALRDARVDVSVVRQYRGRKIVVATYKNKTGSRRRAGHRQHLTRVRVERIHG